MLCERALQTTAYPEFLDKLDIEYQWVDWAPEHSWLKNGIEAFRVFRTTKTRFIQFNISWRRGMWLIPIVARLASAARLIGSMRAMPEPHRDVPRRRHFGFIPGIRLWHVPEVVAGWLWGRLLDLTVSVNASDYPARLASDYGYPMKRIRVIYNGVHLAIAPIDPEKRIALRKGIGAEVNEIVVNFFGRLADHKGVNYLVRSMSLLPSRYRLILMGEGPEEEGLRKLVEELGLDRRVNFLGFVAEVNDFVAASDIVVVPSIWREACPRQIIEAMSLGVPVIASRIGGIPELLVDGVHGLLVPAADANALAAAIQRIGDDPATRAVMGAAARNYAASHYSMDSVVESYSRVYKETEAA